MKEVSAMIKRGQACKYVSETYGVPANIGRRVIVNGKEGIIIADRGNYIGVNFDKDKPGAIINCHPTWKVEYTEMGTIRKMTRSQHRYRAYIEAFNKGTSFR